MADARSNNVNVKAVNASGKGGILFVCEHASNFIPDEFSYLGLDDAALESHAAWDLGAFGVAKHLSASLDAPLIATTISRLVYDCNRPRDAASAVPEKSEIYEIPGNAGLGETARHDRFLRYHEPFHRALEERLQGMPPVRAYVSIHSFTPVFYGNKRDHELGILHDTDSRLADALLSVIDGEGEMQARRNYPYGPDDGVTYSLNLHAKPRGLPNVMFEIRNDLIADEAQQKNMALRLAHYIERALDILSLDEKKAVSS